MNTGGANKQKAEIDNMLEDDQVPIPLIFVRNSNTHTVPCYDVFRTRITAPLYTRVYVIV
jgi:hypothetical protein